MNFTTSFSTTIIKMFFATITSLVVVVKLSVNSMLNLRTDNFQFIAKYHLKRDLYVIT